MRFLVTAPLFIVLAIVSTGSARAERPPSLDEVLAATLQSDAPEVRADSGPKTCRTLTDLGRRSRRATVCMARADWEVLVKSARGPTPRKAAALKLSSVDHAGPYVR